MSDKHTNPIQEKIDALVAERDEILKQQEILKNKFNQYDVRLCEINGSIQVLVELFGKKTEVGATYDTESKTESESSTN